MTPSLALPRTVLALGVVSLLMDLSSETIHALLPLFMANTLGLSMVAIGLLDGGAEALTLAIKPWAGKLSDRWQKRKPLALAGYGLSALAKPLFAIAGGVSLIAGARFLDRLGKGIRGAPRDALIADVTPAEQRGAAYGLRQALDTVGALLAPLLAAGLLWWLAGDYRAVFWLASLPAFAAVLLLWFAVREPAQHIHKSTTGTSAGDRHFGRPFWWVIGLAVLLTLARPGEAFLILRGQSVGLNDYQSALLLAAMNLSYASSVWPVGRHFDRIGAPRLLTGSLLWLLLSQTCLALADGALLAYTGALLWGLHLGFSQGVLAALIAQHAPRERRGAAFGWYALAVGLALLVNGSVFGALWQHRSAAIAFTATGTLALLCLLFALWWQQQRWQQRQR